MNLELRNLKNVYKKTYGKRREVFYDPINNNLIIFTPFDSDVDSNDICNGIRDSAYSYLINELNTEKNVIVHWSAVSGTTSDYTIYYDMPVEELKNKKHKEIYEYLHQLNIDNKIVVYKYTEVRGSTENKITWV